MRKVIRLTEKDLSRLIKRIISEQPTFDPNDLLGAEDRIDDKVTCPVCHVGVKNLTSHCRFRHKHHKCSRGH